MCTLKKGFFVALTVFCFALAASAADTATPATPSEPAATETPAAPASPSTPAQPAASETPAAPAEASAPAAPSTPAQPAAPATPEQTAAPATPATPQQPAAETKTIEQTPTPQFPYIAEIIGTEVYVRSGPGTAYYHCGKISAPQRVTVIGFTHNNWFQIMPPPGSFSWISKNYVKTDPANPKKGSVTGDAVRVWIGSDFVEPMRSCISQIKLNKGADVEIIGDPAGDGDYYKITPPEGSSLWISGDSLRAFQKEETKTQAPAATGDLKDVTVPVAPAAEVKKEEPKKTAEPPRPSMEQTYWKLCRELAIKIESENKKPVTEQKYDEYKKAIEPILADPNNAGSAAQYAQSLSDIIKRYELAITAGAQVQQQDQKMAELRKQIDDAHKAEMERITRKYEQYIMTGTLKPSYVYGGKSGQKRYLLMNEQNRVIAYIVPFDSATATAAEALFNKKVGVVGKVVDSAKELVTVVSATKIEEVTK